MKKPKPIETARCSCFAHDRSECQCGAWHKPAPMVWHKLSEERPTEMGDYLIWNGTEIGYVLHDEINRQHFTHWMLITPPEREEK